MLRLIAFTVFIAAALCLAAFPLTGAVAIVTESDALGRAVLLELGAAASLWLVGCAVWGASDILESTG